jgi:hypothetical protein
MNMDTAIVELLDAIKTDYAAWHAASPKSNPIHSAIKDKMIAEFNAGLRVEPGRKYIKIVSGGSVWGFIVDAEGDKFPRGSILKAAGWATPARNHARGNILSGGYTVKWTGPLYMN